MGNFVAIQPTMFNFINPNQFLDHQKLTDLLLSQGHIEYMELAVLIAAGFRSCIDGRWKKGIIGSFGGNMGEFVKALQALENSTGKHLNSDEVYRIFQWLLQAFGSPFYMHTDTHARDHIIDMLKSNPRYTGSIPTAATFEDWIWAGPEGRNTQELLQNHMAMVHIMTTASGVGCGHLNRMLKQPLQYGIRPELVKSAIAAFFNVMWTGTSTQKQQLLYTVLEHEHAEQIVLQVYVDGDIDEKTCFPLLKPNCCGTQMFVHHPQVGSFIDLTIAGHIAGTPLLKLMDSFNKEKYLAEMSSLAGQFSTETVSQLALALPVVQVCFAKDWQLQVAA